MAKTMFKSLMVRLLISSLLILQLTSSAAQVSAPPAGSLTSPEIDCDAACNVRCALSSRPNLCKRACGTCCDRCACVPPGTSGNHDACPCYRDMATHGGLRKCP